MQLTEPSPARQQAADAREAAAKLEGRLEAMQTQITELLRALAERPAPAPVPATEPAPCGFFCASAERVSGLALVEVRRRNPPFSPFSEIFDAEILPPPYKGESFRSFFR